MNTAICNRFREPVLSKFRMFVYISSNDTIESNLWNCYLCVPHSMFIVHYTARFGTDPASLIAF